MLKILSSPLRFPLANAPSTVALQSYRHTMADRTHARLQAVLETARAGTLASPASLGAAEQHALTTSTSASHHPVERLDHAIGAGGAVAELLNLIASVHFDHRVQALIVRLQPDTHLGVDVDVVTCLASASTLQQLPALLGPGGHLQRLGLVTVRQVGTRRMLTPD